MYAAPDYRLPKYGLNEKQLDLISILKRMPLWRRRKLHKQMSGLPRSTFIYRYLTFDPSNGLSVKKVRDLVVESTLYLPSPNDFNDPWDFRAEITLTENAVERRQWLERSARNLLANGSDPLPAVHGRHRKIETLVARAMRKSIVSPDSMNESFGRAREKNGVACFSEDPRGLLLWALYSAGHTGICLQFDVTKDHGVLMLGNRVHYNKELPRLTWPRDREDIVDKVILSKGQDWAHEKEVRYVSLHVTRDSLPFDGGALRAIIVGSRFHSSHYDHLEEMIGERVNRGLPYPIVYEAKEKTKEYGIRIIRRWKPA